MENNQNQSPENIFKQKVSNVAYDYMRTTYPDLVPYIITLKLEDTDIDKGTAAAIFLIKKGNDIAYIPVIVADNTVLSCEVIYYKNENIFFPLIGKEISRIVNINSIVPSTLVKSPKINTTYNFFRNMYRPPLTERIALASDDTDMLTNLPNKYKDAVLNTIKSNKDLLKKVAEFYDIDELVNKLSTSNESENNIEIPKLASIDDVVSVVTINDLDDKSHLYITKEAAEDITTRGYHIMPKVAYDKDIIYDCTVDNNVTITNGIQEISLEDTRSGITCDLYASIDGKVQLLNKAIIVGSKVYHSSGVYEISTLYPREVHTCRNKLQIAANNISDGIDAHLFIEYGARYLVPYFDKIKGKADKDIKKVGLFIQDKKGKYHHVKEADNEVHHIGKVHGFFVYPQDIQIFTDTSDAITIKIADDDKYEAIRYIKSTDTLRHSIIYENNTIYVPQSTIAMDIPCKDVKKITLLTLKQVTEHIKKQLPKYTIISSSKEFHIKNGIVKLQSFTKEASLANYLHNQLDIPPTSIYNLIDKVKGDHLGNKAVDFYLMEKNAAEFNLANGNPQGIVQQNLGLQVSNPSTMAYKPNSGNPNLMGKGLPPVVDSNTLSIYANGFNKTIMDIGILSSLYNNEDIKTYLLDYVPQFIETVSNLGKIIILFNLNKEQLINKYGTGEYHSIISTIRKIFKSLAEIIIDLERYIGTLSTLPAEKQQTKGLHNNNKMLNNNI